MSHHVGTLLCCALGACLLSAGCGETDTGRRPLKGRVTVDGEPLSDGTISFLPQPGTSGPAATTIVSSGRYQFTQHTGPVSGSHRVLIGGAAEPQTSRTAEKSGDSNALPSDGSTTIKRKVPSPPMRSTSAKSQSSLQQSLQWEQEFTVPAAGNAEQNFDLES